MQLCRLPHDARRAPRTTIPPPWLSPSSRYTSRLPWAHQEAAPRNAVLVHNWCTRFTGAHAAYRRLAALWPWRPSSCVVTLQQVSGRGTLALWVPCRWVSRALAAYMRLVKRNAVALGGRPGEARVPARDRGQRTTSCSGTSGPWGSL